MYGINEFLVLQRVTASSKREGRATEHVRWIKEADLEERRARRRAARRRWSSFVSLFLF